MQLATYFIRHDFLAQEVFDGDTAPDGHGVRVVWDAEAQHGFGEFIAWADFMDGEFDRVDYPPVDWSDLGPYNQQFSTIEVFQKWDESLENPS